MLFSSASLSTVSLFFEELLSTLAGGVLVTSIVTVSADASLSAAAASVSASGSNSGESERR